jgi:hypothetical protein
VLQKRLPVMMTIDDPLGLEAGDRADGRQDEPPGDGRAHVQELLVAGVPRRQGPFRSPIRGGRPISFAPGEVGMTPAQALQVHSCRRAVELRLEGSVGASRRGSSRPFAVAGDPLADVTEMAAREVRDERRRGRPNDRACVQLMAVTQHAVNAITTFLADHDPRTCGIRAPSSAE